MKMPALQADRKNFVDREDFLRPFPGSFVFTGRTGQNDREQITSL
jgi:hypothetical protein